MGRCGRRTKECARTRALAVVTPLVLVLSPGCGGGTAPVNGGASSFGGTYSCTSIRTTNPATGLEPSTTGTYLVTESGGVVTMTTAPDAPTTCTLHLPLTGERAMLDHPQVCGVGQYTLDYTAGTFSMDREVLLGTLVFSFQLATSSGTGSESTMCRRVR
jgi:hypothetical protein